MEALLRGRLHYTNRHRIAGKLNCIYALGHIEIKDLAAIIWKESNVGFIIPKEAENENKKEEQESRGEEVLDEDPKHEKDQPIKKLS